MTDKPHLVDLQLELWNTGNPELLTQVYCESSERFDPNNAEPARGPQQIAKYIAEIRTAFPDFRIAFDETINEGDQFVYCWSCTGTHRGDFQGIPATGKKVQMTGVTLERISGGRVVQERVYFDRLSLLQQIGALPG